MELFHHSSALLLVHRGKDKLTFKSLEKRDFHLIFAVDVEGFAKVIAEIVGPNIFDLKGVVGTNGGCTCQYGIAMADPTNNFFCPKSGKRAHDTFQ